MPAAHDLHPRTLRASNAISGDEVLVRIVKSPSSGKRGPKGDIVQVLERATSQFVGTYFERDGQGFVRVDGTVFTHSIFVGDPGAKGASPTIKSSSRCCASRPRRIAAKASSPRFSGRTANPASIRCRSSARSDCPTLFPKTCSKRPGRLRPRFNEEDPGRPRGFHRLADDHHRPGGRPRLRRRRQPDASTRERSTGSWASTSPTWATSLRRGSALDREARKRGTSVYLPQRVIPMFPEIISNSLASLQQGKVRFVKSALIDLTPTGQKTRRALRQRAPSRCADVSPMKRCRRSC